MQLTQTRWRGARMLAATCASVLALCLALPALAGATITPGRSVAGVALGDSAAHVRDVLGKPEAGSNVLNYRYIRSRGIGIYFIAGKVFEISVVRGPQATRKGVKIGSTKAALVSAYPRVKCRPAAVGGGTLECRLAARFRQRATETLFTTKRDKVVRIAVHFV